MNLLNITEEVLLLEQELKDKPPLNDKQEIIQHLAQLLLNAVDKRTHHQNIGIAFSGGVDSTTLAAILTPVLRKRLICIAIDTGGVRAKELEEIKINA